MKHDAGEIYCMDSVIITGASRGIGKATKELFEVNGYNVIAPTRKELDLSSNESILKFCESLALDKIFAVINNAGINDIAYLDSVGYDQIMNMLQIDLTAPILMLNKLIPKLKNNGEGRIVNIGSIWAVVSKSGRSLYSAAKNGIHGITNALALELGDHSILCNTVCPGFTLTELTKKNNTVEQIKNISAEIPIKRMATPEEIAKLIYFLGSRENTYITGQKIIIDGGYTAK